MIELPLIFVAGILGTAHCLGMCGPFALAIGSATSSWSSALAKQSAYTAGRIFTYGALGAMSGFCGAWLVRAFPAVVNIPALLAVIAGALLVIQGLKATGLFRERGIAPATAPCLAGGLLRSFLRQGTAAGTFLAGVFTGFLPCGLLYGMLALAMSTHSVVLGATILVIFGLGTAPAMMLVGMSGRLMSLTLRRRVYAIAAWCLMAAGVVSVARGMSFLMHGGESALDCPMCTHRNIQ